ncbi:MAG: hypothetical protein NTW95_00830 [Candidatus Aminicenantes bacterium]|nr:hypothetical protein [Candidatus Aminicenantes bacterium]
MKTLHVTERSSWRAWLRAHGEKEKEIWLVFYKRHTGKKRLEYDDAVEEALCFGWIDSIIKRLDEVGGLPGRVAYTHQYAEANAGLTDIDNGSGGG